MPDAKVLVLDANILIRAVLGRRVRNLLARYCGSAQFLVPDAMLREAQEHLPVILSGQGIPTADGLAVLRAICGVVQVMEVATYSSFEKPARLRLKARDQDDWPVIATALAFNCPIWTEDADFFGAGVATWTTDRVEMFFEDVANR